MVIKMAFSKVLFIFVLLIICAPVLSLQHRFQAPFFPENDFYIDIKTQKTGFPDTGNIRLCIGQPPEKIALRISTNLKVFSARLQAFFKDVPDRRFYVKDMLVSCAIPSEKEFSKVIRQKKFEIKTNEFVTNESGMVYLACVPGKGIISIEKSEYIGHESEFKFFDLEVIPDFSEIRENEKLFQEFKRKKYALPSDNIEFLKKCVFSITSGTPHYITTTLKNLKVLNNFLKRILKHEDILRKRGTAFFSVFTSFFETINNVSSVLKQRKLFFQNDPDVSALNTKSLLVIKTVYENLLRSYFLNSLSAWSLKHPIPIFDFNDNKLVVQDIHNQIYILLSRIMSENTTIDEIEKHFNNKLLDIYKKMSFIILRKVYDLVLNENQILEEIFTFKQKKFSSILSDEKVYKIPISENFKDIKPILGSAKRFIKKDFFDKLGKGLYEFNTAIGEQDFLPICTDLSDQLRSIDIDKSISNEENSQNEQTDIEDPLKERILKYSRFAICKKIETEINNELQGFKDFIDKSSLKITGELDRSVNKDKYNIIYGELILTFWGIDKGESLEFDDLKKSSLINHFQVLEHLKSVLRAFSTAVTEKISSGVYKSLCKDLEALSHTEASILELLSFFIVHSKDITENDMENYQKLLEKISRDLTKLSVQIGETFAKLVMEDWYIPGTVSLFSNTSETGIISFGKNNDFICRIRNIGMTDIEELKLDIFSGPGITSQISGIPVLRNTGIDEDRKIKFSIRSGAEFSEYLKEIFIYALHKDKKYLLGSKKIILHEKIPPQINSTNYGKNKIWNLEKKVFKNIILEIYDSSGINPDSLKVSLNGKLIKNREYDPDISQIKIGIDQSVFKDLKRVNSLMIECADFCGNILSTEYRIQFKYSIYDYIFLLISCLLILIFVLYLRLKGNWMCPACGISCKWYTIGCKKCSYERKDSLILRMVFPILRMGLQILADLFTGLKELALELKEKSHVKRIRKRLFKNLGELGRECVIYIESYPEYKSDPAVSDILTRLSVCDKKFFDMEESVRNMRKRGESGDYYTHRGESLWNFARSINTALEEIDSVRTEKVGLEIELGKTVYLRIKGGKDMSGTCSDLASDIFAMEKELIISGIKNIFD